MDIFIAFIGCKKSSFSFKENSLQSLRVSLGTLCAVDSMSS